MIPAIDFSLLVFDQAVVGLELFEFHRDLFVVLRQNCLITDQLPAALLVAHV